jgi:hypothetical protein
VEVVGQGVPAHIGTTSPGYGYDGGDPYGDFLPPPVPVRDIEDGSLRAMVIVRSGSVKIGQRYESPLAVMSGSEYVATTFETLVERICDALRGGGPRFVGSFTRTDGVIRSVFDDGSIKDSPSVRE